MQIGPYCSVKHNVIGENVVAQLIAPVLVPYFSGIVHEERLAQSIAPLHFDSVL
ncbi:MAG TPA: hypothetical protein VKR42_00670 [Ktedonobacteraceae bacterium]|nr:hypothetical protein [Ktedonobacteraceae bacterium]